MFSVKHLLTLALSLTVLLLSLGNAQAALVSNQQIIYQTTPFENKQTLLQTLQRDEVQQQLASMGVNPAELEQRVNHMTPGEITQLNQKMAQQPAGSGVLGTLLVIFIVFVITDVIGATDIFPFIDPVY